MAVWSISYFLFCLIFFYSAFTLEYTVLSTLREQRTARASSGENWQIRPPTKFHSLTPTIVTRSGESAESSCAVWSDSCCLSINTVQTVQSMEYGVQNNHTRTTEYTAMYVLHPAIDIRISLPDKCIPFMQEPSHSLSPEIQFIQSIQKRNEVPSLHCPVGHAAAFLSTGSSQPMEYYAVQSTTWD